MWRLHHDSVNVRRNAKAEQQLGIPKKGHFHTEIVFLS